MNEREIQVRARRWVKANRSEQGDANRLRRRARPGGG